MRLLDDLRLEDFRLPLLEVFRELDFLRLLLVSPACLRCLLTVAAAICFARLGLRPSFRSDSLMCSYWRLRLALLTPLGGIYGSPSRVGVGSPVRQEQETDRMIGSKSFRSGR